MITRRVLFSVSIIAGAAAVILGTLASVKPILAQESGTGPLKIGVVNRKLVFDGYAKAQAELKASNAKKEQREATLKSQLTAIETKKDRLKSAAGTGKLTQDEGSKLTLEIQADMADYESNHRKFTVEVNAEQEKIFFDARIEIDQVVAKFATAQNYDLILESDPALSSGIIYAARTLDVTSQVVQLVNVK